MINKNVERYFDNKWPNYYKTVTYTSASGNEEPLIVAKNKEYDFDSIVKDTFLDNDNPNSVDAVRFTDEGCFFVEYKSGFRDKITVQNVQVPVQCKEHSEVLCTNFFEFYNDARNKAKGALIVALQMKAIESYVFFERCILPLVSDSNDKIRLTLHIVIDIDPVKRMKQIQERTSNEKEDEDIKAVRQSLHRLVNVFRESNDDYYFDDVSIWSSSRYKIYLAKYGGQ